MDANQDAPLKQRIPLSPLAPLWARAFAFSLDVAILWLAFYLPWRFAPGQAARFSPVALPIQFALAWLYFALANGPVGKGVTFGKLVADIQTVRPGGEPLGMGPAFVRATLQMLPFAFVFAAFSFEADPLSFGQVAGAVIVQFAGLGLLAGNIAHMVSSPLTQGWHDRAGDTLTPRRPVGALFQTTVRAAAPYREEVARRALQAAIFGTVAVAGMSSCDIGPSYARLTDPEARAALEMVQEAREAAQARGILPLMGPLEHGAGEDGVTTATLRIAYVFNGSAPSDLDADELEAASRDVFAKWSADPALAQKLLFGRELDKETEEPRVRSHVQIREVEVSAFESYPVLLSRQRRRVVEPRAFEARFPPDALVVPRLPGEIKDEAAPSEEEAAAAPEPPAEAKPEEPAPAEEKPKASEPPAEAPEPETIASSPEE